MTQQYLLTGSSASGIIKNKPKVRSLEYKKVKNLLSKNNLSQFNCQENKI
ncbi:unnamed protein product [Larinioides sclopetarius]|uniref:Uncharacterized protein n=1 Tax=Larinioides sclopetarius TaxID=280406 RepID=A0AAV2AEY8_9ARAC